MADNIKLNEEELSNITGGSSVLPDKFVEGEGTITRKMCPKCGYPMNSDGHYYGGLPAVKCTNPACECSKSWQYMG